MTANSGTRGVVKHAFIYGLGTLLSRAVSFIMLPVYTRVLTPADYGTLALIEMTLDVISIGAGAQLAYAIYRFYHKADTEAEKNTVVSTVFFSLMLSYVLVAALTATFATELSVLLFKSPDNASLIRIASGGLASQCLMIVPSALLQVRERSATMVQINLVKLVMQLSMNILFLVGMGLGVKGILLSTLIANTTIGFGLSIWTIRTVGISFSSDVLRSLVRYAGPLIGMQFATFFTTFGDRYFLKAYGDEASVGLFNLSYQFAFLMYGIGFGPFMQMWGPRRFAVARNPDEAQRDRELSAGFGYLNVILLPVAVGIALFVGDVLRLMTTPPFFGAAGVVPILLFAYVLMAWASVLDLGILIRERTEFLTLSNWVTLVVALLGWVLLVRPFGATGAAAVTVLSLFARFALTYHFAQRLWFVAYDWRPILRMLFVGAAIVGLAAFLPTLPWIASVALHSLMAAVFLFYVWQFGPLSHDEKRSAIALARSRLGLATS